MEKLQKIFWSVLSFVDKLAGKIFEILGLIVALIIGAITVVVGISMAFAVPIAAILVGLAALKFLGVF